MDHERCSMPHLTERGFAIICRADPKVFALKLHTRQLHEGRLIIYEKDEFIHDSAFGKHRSVTAGRID
jgi:hypothetical protein